MSTEIRSASLKGENSWQLDLVTDLGSPRINLRFPIIQIILWAQLSDVRTNIHDYIVTVYC